MFLCFKGSADQPKQLKRLKRAANDSPTPKRQPQVWCMVVGSQNVVDDHYTANPNDCMLSNAKDSLRASAPTLDQKPCNIKQLTVAAVHLRVSPIR